MVIRPTQSDAAPRDNSHAWYRQSIVWLGVLVFIASIVGCVWLIVVAQRYADPELPVIGPQVMKVPVARPPKPDKSP